MIEEANELYAVRPPDFVARRNALVRQLKADGRTDDAKAVGILRRPRLSEYALNAAVRTDDALGPRFATAVADATSAQSAAIGGGGADAMRTATRELRAATATLIEAAVQQLAQHGTGGGERDEIERLLRSLANRSGVELLQAGLVGSSVVDADDLFAGAPEPLDQPAHPRRAPAGATTRSRGRTTAPATADAPARNEKPSPSTHTAPGPQRASDARSARAEAARRRRLEAERGRARSARRAAERDESAARDALDAAVRAQAKAEGRLEQARTSLDAAKAAVQALDEELADRGSTG